MDARANRGVGKSDPLHARRIAQAVLPLDDAQLVSLVAALCPHGWRRGR